MSIASLPSRVSLDWNDLADRVLDGHVLSAEEGLSVLNSSDLELLSLLDAAYRVRRQHFGNEVQLYMLKNAKSGLCPEDCGYCSQNINSKAPIPKYSLLSEEKLMAGAKAAFESNAQTYCIVTSGRGPTNGEVDRISQIVKKIKATYGLHICCCLGLLEPHHAETLAAAGVDRVNHNLNTSRRYYEQICSTHTYEDRLNTLKTVRNAGMELCSGVIAGMGETHDDLVETALQLRELNVESLPVNFLNSIEGTDLEAVQVLNPRFCLKVLCLFRLANPKTEIRVAGGREVNLRSMQAMSMYPANSLFLSDYLTTKGQAPEEDFRMIEDLGFTLVKRGFDDEESPATIKSEGSCEGVPVAPSCSGSSCC